MKRRLLSLCMALALCLGLLPATALAAENAPSTLIVGNITVDLTNGGYWTTDTDGKLTSSDENNYNVHYDKDTNTLTLKGATIKSNYDSTYNQSDAGIYATSASGQAVSLTINLEGTNEVSGSTGIFVYSPDNGGEASLTIKGNGSLTATGSQHGIKVQSNNNDATLSIQAVKIETKGGNYTNEAGVCLQAGNSASSNASLTVDGGSLTASGDLGIQYSFGVDAVTGTPSLTVSGNALVDARDGGIRAGDSSSAEQVTPTGSNGIVFDGNNGTVYGNVTLQEDLTIGAGESLTIGQGASLDTGSHNLIVDGGTVTGDVTGTVIYKVTSVTLDKTSLTLNVGGTATLTATVEPTEAANLTYQWQQSTDNGSNWTDISGANSATYTTAAATVSMNGYQYRCVVKGDGGSEATSNTATLTVNAAQCTVTFDANGGTGTMTAVTVDKGDSYTLPANGFTAPTGKQFKGWATSADGSVIMGGTITVSTDVTLYAIWEDSGGSTHFHSWATGWSGNGDYHWKECTAAGCNLPQGVADSGKDSYGTHTYGSWTVTAPATSTTPGSQERTCSTCSWKETETIPATGGTGTGSGSGTCGSAPAIIDPANDWGVIVYVGETATLDITALRADSYQWYVDRGDGRGFVPIPGATGPQYITSAVTKDNDGYVYRCVAMNAYGQATGPNITLEVMEYLEIPKTGDNSRIGLYIGLMMIGLAGMGFSAFMMYGRKRES